MSNLIFALLAILVSVTIVTPVQATTISLVPHPAKVHVPPPANVSVDIIISDLPTYHNFGSANGAGGVRRRSCL